MIGKSLAFVLVVLLVSFAETRRGKGEKNRERLKNRAVRENGSQGSCELEVTCKNDAGQMPVKLPIRGPKGPPGQPGQKGDAGEPGTPGLPGIPGRSRAETPKVAFFAGLRENVGLVEKNTDINFDKVITNRGGAYNAKTGRFTAPYNGTYHFSAVVAAQGRQKAAVMIVKNGEMVATVWAESIPYWATASNSVVLDLKRNDQVWLIQLARAPYLHGYMYSTFSGFIIFKDDSEEKLEE